ncbi:hypothetical protein [Neisseria lactamica]|uniref:hypothetical protein n=1 Tax=Neisseria lactamica TaxID=486 RepID=UPI0018C88E7F|nr:hypothetical protein [Neisseria lactamica]
MPSETVSRFRRHPPSPSFPRKWESRPLDSGNIQKSSENLEVLDSRFRGNDEKLRE